MADQGHREPQGLGREHMDVHTPERNQNNSTQSEPRATRDQQTPTQPQEINRRHTINSPNAINIIDAAIIENTHNLHSTQIQHQESPEPTNPTQTYNTSPTPTHTQTNTTSEHYTRQKRIRRSTPIQHTVNTPHKQSKHDTPKPNTKPEQYILESASNGTEPGKRVRVDPARVEGSPTNNTNTPETVAPTTDNNRTKSRFHIRIEIHGHEFNALIDTGATHSYLGAEVIQILHNTDTPIDDTLDRTATMGNGTQVTIERTVTLPIRLENDDEIELQDTDKWTDHLRRLQTLRDEVQRHLIEANEKQAHYYNLRRRDIQFKEGDRVLKKNHTLSSGPERTAAKRKRQHGRQTTKNTGPNDTTTNETNDNNNGHTNKQRKNSTTTNTRTSPTPTQIRTRRHTPDRDPTNSTTDTHYTHTSNKKRHDSNTDHNHRTHNHPETPTNTHTNDHTHSHTLRTNAMPKVQRAGPGHKILTTHTDLHTNKHRQTTPTNSHPNYTNHNHAHDDTPTHQQTNTPHNHTPHIDSNTSTHTTPGITPFMDTHQTHETTDNR
ncbi:GATA zinc finger domain-containing protein 14-like [Neodiprion lecontei]|uniref:GATA zinc finger domain-containing protein 14-like n=1 Tax=Neodiprion lecontei TaxID=441921 RepID=A0ABM3FQD9_NEOLC|nr:GATA zinc finger domain-containing protein 14-like [Neodiprion lecontei]